MTEQKTDIKQLQVIFGEDLDLFLFYLSWIKNGLTAGKAYKELHPEVTEHSARTLGSRMLSKVDKGLVMQAYGLDQQIYFHQLKEGIEATKWNDFTGDREADHKTRREYHKTLGKLLGIERDDETPPIQVNVGVFNNATQAKRYSIK